MVTQEQWIRHFRDMAEGRIQPTANGTWIVKDYDTVSSEEPADAAPVQIVSQTQQAVDQAKTTRKRKRKEAKRTYAKPSGSWRNF